MKKRRNIQLYKKRIKRRGKREWRLVIKLGSKLGDWEEIQRRKELATSLSHRAIALVKNDTIWKKNWKTKLTTRIQLYAKTLVKSALLEPGVCQRMTSQRKLNSFHFIEDS